MASLYILDARTTEIRYFVKPINPVLMKRRIRRIANFFAFNLLFFALYLNFIHKDKTAAALPEQGVQTTAAVSGGGTILVSHPEKYLEPKAASTTGASSQ